MAEEYNFQYTPLTGRLPGKSFVKQTEKAINELAKIVNEGSAQVEVITNLANTANANSEEALEKANEALETAGRVYITLPNLDDADDYFDSQLYYFANSYSANLPVQDTGFLEVKTNDTKTAAEQVFVADTTGLMYMRHGNITSTEVGDETVYSVTWETWSSALASETYVQTEVNIGINSANDYTDNRIATRLPLTGGTMNGDITLNGSALKNIDDVSYTDIYGGTSSDGGAYIRLRGKDSSSSAGNFVIRAYDGTNSVFLVGTPAGSLQWKNKEVERVNASGTDYIRYESGLQICWGTVSARGSAYDGVVTYPVPFISNPNFQGTLGNLSNNPTNYTIQTKSATATGISVGVGNGSTWSSGLVRWLAIGLWK